LFVNENIKIIIIKILHKTKKIDFELYIRVSNDNNDINATNNENKKKIILNISKSKT